MCCIAGWAAANGILLFYTLDKLGMLRVAPDMEFRGRRCQMVSSNIPELNFIFG